MNPLRKLLSQTAIYGLPTILGRLLNYLLVPLHTNIIEDTSKYGVISELYAYVAFLIVLLTFGMETAFFRFFHDKDDKEAVFKNSFLTVIGINLIFLFSLLLFNQDIADALLHSDHPEYIILLGIIVCIDATAALPMARLRAENKALRFSVIQFSSIAVNIGLNLFLMLVVFDKNHPEEGVLFILIANLIASLVKIVGTYKDFIGIRFTFNKQLAIEMLKYAAPLVIAGFAGIINETLDRVLLKQLLYTKAGMTLRESEAQLGIYSACYKLAMIVSILLQAYRFAAEPFFFSQAKDENKNKTYIRIMNYFVAAMCVVFLGVALNIDIFKYFIGKPYWEGLHVVPILLIANIFLGIYFNQSIWYKLSGQTRFGAYIALVGAAFTILINVIFIPVYGYNASAWATLFVYGLQMIISYFMGQKHYPIKYNLRKFSLYLGLALLLYVLTLLINVDPNTMSMRKFILHNGLIIFYLLIVWFIEKPQMKSQLTSQG